MKLRLIPAVALLSCLLAAHVGAQELSPTVPSPGAEPPAAPAPAPAPQAPMALPPVERLATEAQQQLFKAADQGGSGNEAPTGNTPRVTTTGKRTTFSAPKVEDPATWEKDSMHKLAVMEVSFGGATEEVMFELYPQDAPMTVSNFMDNCETDAYKGLAFHRAIEGFIVQTGDPLTSDEGTRDRWGTGGDAKSVPAEIKRRHAKGSVAMGRRGDKVNPSRKSNGYQFYFALGNYSALDGKYTVFGQVVSGIEVLEKIGKMPVDSNDCPVARIEIKSLKVVDHKGPLHASAKRDSGDGRKYTKPAAAKGFFERLLERVW